MPEIFRQLGVGKRKSQNKQIVWKKKMTSAMHGQRSRDDVLQDQQLCVLVARKQRGKQEARGSKMCRIENTLQRTLLNSQCEKEFDGKPKVNK